jgi:hypothetical protein
MKLNGILKYTLILLNFWTILTYFLKTKSEPALITIKSSKKTINRSNNHPFYNISSHYIITNLELLRKTKSNSTQNSKKPESNYSKIKIDHVKNTTLNTSLNNKLIKKQKSSITFLIRNKFYDICFQIFNYSETSVSCEKAEMIEDIFFNCNDKKFEELKKKLNNSENKYSEKIIKIINQKSFTMEMRNEIFKYSSCVKDTPVLELDFGLDYINRNQMRINLQNGFFKRPEPIFSFSPIGKEMNFKLMIEEINKSQRLLRNYFPGENEENKLNELDNIELSENDDLFIEKVKVFSGKLSVNEFDNNEKTHKSLYLCAKNDKNSAYHFLVDKTPRDPQKERIIMESAKIKKDFMYEDKSLKTSIRVIYIKKTKDCNEDLKYERLELEIHEEFLNDKDLANESNYNKGNKIIKEKSSFKNFIIAIQRYALDNQNFTKEKNSGFFAEGFLNYLLINKNNRINFANSNKNNFGIKEKSFEVYFRNESDEVFINKLNARIIN